MNRTALMFKALIALLLIYCLIVIYIPQSIYFAQREYFADYFFSLIGSALVSGLLLVGVVLIVLAVLPKSLLKFVVAVLLLLSLLLWVHVDFFAVSYGVLDGSDINFSHFNQRGYIELAVYGLAVVFALVFSRFVLKQLPFLVLLVLIGLVAVTSINIYQEPKDKELVEEIDSEFFKYSSDKNVILIVLDTFGSSYFQHIINLTPDITENYKGFVSYTDAISNYPATKGSVPSFLTGEMIPENIKYRKYLTDYMSPKGLPRLMSNNGYLVSIISVYRWFKDFYPERYIYQPQVSQEGLSAFYGAQLLDFSLFRVFPHIFKPAIYDGGNWFFSADVAVATEVPNTFPERGSALMKMMTDNAVVDSENKQPRFKMIHVSIPHPQYVYDKNCNKSQSNQGIPVTYLMSQQSKCALKLLDDLLDQYKTMGIYDESLIVVTSDHGSRVMSDRSMTGFPSYFEMNTSGIMFMIKGINQTTPFKQVDTPFSLLKLKEALQNEELHSTPYDFLKHENRQFYAFRNNHKAAPGYMQDAPLFSVGENFDQPSSWQLERFAVNNCKAEKLPLTLTFTQVGREGYCSLYGFADPDGNSNGAWTQSVDSRIVMKIRDKYKKTGQLKTIKLSFTPRILDKQSGLNLEVLINGQLIGKANFDTAEKQLLSFQFNADLLKKKEFDVLQFNLAAGKSNADQKKLGLLFESIELY